MIKSLCVLNKSAGSTPTALASVGLGLDNQGCRIKTRGRNTRVILLARIPSALLACLPQSGGGESKGREREKDRERLEWGKGRPELYRQQQCGGSAKQLCMQVSFAQITMQCSACICAYRHPKYICLCIKITCKPL